MYDIYLTCECSTLPYLTDLARTIPHIGDPFWQQRLQTFTSETRGFLGLDLQKSQARKLLQRIQEAHGEAIIADTAYRQPAISQAEALGLALDAVFDRRDAYFSTYHFHPIAFHSEKAMTWTFFSASDQLMAEGHIPGGIFVDIDKIDGHIWQPEEFTEQI